jgi:hypothetical protein
MAALAPTLAQVIQTLNLIVRFESERRPGVDEGK